MTTSMSRQRCDERPYLSARRDPPRAVDAVRWAVDMTTGVSLHQAVCVCDRLRFAAQARYGELTGRDTSDLLSGRSHHNNSKRDDNHQHAHYLAFSGPDRSDRRISALVTWARNEGSGMSEREVEALGAVDHVMPVRGVSGIPPLRVTAVAAGPVDEIAPELCGIRPATEGHVGATSWESWTPYVPSHFPRRRPRNSGEWYEHLREDVLRELSYRRWLPAHAEIQIMTGDWHFFRTNRPQKPADGVARAVGIRMSFDTPVRGPLALGRFCHFGLGLFRPVSP